MENELKDIRQAIVKQARSYLDVPFKHIGRSREGIDCVGLVIEVAHDLGLSDYDIRTYSPIPDMKMMGRLLREHLVQIPIKKIQIADIVWLASPEYCHLAILCDGSQPFSMVHAYVTVKRVTENRLAPSMMSKVASAYSYPRVAAWQD